MIMLRTAFAFALMAFATPGLADGGIQIDAPYVRLLPAAKSAAAFFGIDNQSGSDDRLLSVRADIAAKVELHTHQMGADGMAMMRPIEGGIAIAAGAQHMLQSGGDHVMMMMLTARPANGAMVTLTLTFEKAGDITVQAPVDNSR